MINQLGYHLERAGLTNRNSEDWGTLATRPPIKQDPFCTSAQCCGSGNWSPVKKVVEGKPDLCPDCGLYLLYKRAR